MRQYLAIEQARFSDRLRVAFAVDDALLAAAVPSFALQHLVENAVRHGIARHPDAGRIAVEARRAGDMLVLSVRDDGPGIGAAVIAGPGPRPGTSPAETPESGVAVSVAVGVPHGLENTRQRLKALYDERASLTVVREPPRGTMATLRVPYHEIAMDAGVAG